MICAVSALGRRNGTVVERLYCLSFRKGLVRTNTSTWPARLPCLRSFSAPRLANSVTASLRFTNSVTVRPKDRVQAISCFGAGAWSSSIQDVPCNSRTVRSRTTDQRRLTVAGSSWTSSNTVLMPTSFSCLVICRPTPQTSLTGVAAITASSSG